MFVFSKFSIVVMVEYNILNAVYKLITIQITSSEISTI